MKRRSFLLPFAFLAPMKNRHSRLPTRGRTGLMPRHAQGNANAAREIAS
jgi:hypothetical protein